MGGIPLSTKTNSLVELTESVTVLPDPARLTVAVDAVLSPSDKGVSNNFSVGTSDGGGSVPLPRRVVSDSETKNNVTECQLISGNPSILPQTIWNCPNTTGPLALTWLT